MWLRLTSEIHAAAGDEGRNLSITNNAIPIAVPKRHSNARIAKNVEAVAVVIGTRLIVPAGCPLLAAAIALE